MESPKHKKKKKKKKNITCTINKCNRLIYVSSFLVKPNLTISAKCVELQCVEKIIEIRQCLDYIISIALDVWKSPLNVECKVRVF